MADVSGTWLGTYWQEGTPTRFEATFVQSMNTLTGNILDDCELGEALVSGEVVGRSINFTKRYLNPTLGSISYSGQISEDENFMSGTWKVGKHKGTWEASRGTQDLMADLKSVLAKKVPAGVS